MQKQPLEVFYKKKVFLKNQQGKHLCWSLFLIKLQQIRPESLLKVGSNTDVSCEICEIFKNTYFEEHLPTDASINERERDTYALLGKKNESHLVKLLRGQ